MSYMTMDDLHNVESGYFSKMPKLIIVNGQTWMKRSIAPGHPGLLVGDGQYCYTCDRNHKLTKCPITHFYYKKKK